MFFLSLWGGDRNDGSHLYRPKKTADEESYGDELDKLSRQRRFVPDKGFADSDRLRRLDGPVQFEKDEEDPFGLNKFLSEAKKAQKRPNNAAADGEPGPSGRKRDHREWSICASRCDLYIVASYEIKLLCWNPP